MTTAVLITGTSSGIGRASALRLARRPELTVYATARRPETLTDLADAGARILPLDVTDEESMTHAVEAVQAEHGSVGVLVNNATTASTEQSRKPGWTVCDASLRQTCSASPV